VKRGLYLRFCLLGAILWCSTLWAQSWPQRAVKVVVPFVAGGNTDNQARIVSERLAATLGQPFVVENRVGAGGAIAAEFVAKSAPDGYTLFFAASPQFSLPLLQKVNFDPYKDFIPVSIVGTNPFVLGIHESVPAKTVKEFVDYVKARPGQLNYASAGAGTTTHLTGALFLSRAGLKMAHVAYKGGAQAVADLVGGQVQMYFGNASELIQHSKSGRITLLGVSSEKRTPQLPDVPAIAETYPGFRSGTWNGYLAPAGTPAAIVQRLAQEVAKVVREPATAERLRSIGVEPMGNTPEQFAEYVRRDAPIWKDAVNAAGIKAD
jgi:tripartite-type tricarboxylate transporter receptor subunit TctC